MFEEAEGESKEGRGETGTDKETVGAISSLCGKPPHSQFHLFALEGAEVVIEFDFKEKEKFGEEEPEFVA